MCVNFAQNHLHKLVFNADSLNTCPGYKAIDVYIIIREKPTNLYGSQCHKADIVRSVPEKYIQIAQLPSQIHYSIIKYV